MLHYCVDIEEKFNEYFQKILYRMNTAKKKERILCIKFVTTVNSTGCSRFIARIHGTLYSNGLACSLWHNRGHFRTV